MNLVQYRAVKPPLHRIRFGVSVATTRTVGRDDPIAPSADTLKYAYQYDDIGNRITSTDLGTSYSGLLSGSEHGSLSDMEPADRAPDRPARWDASVNTTVETLQPYMKDWCEKCCMKIQAIEAEDARRQSKSRERIRLWEALMLSLP